MTDLELIGRSSSHFTRTARIFAIELGVAHAFRPVLDLTTSDLEVYAGNPALKIPVLVTPEGPWFGSENVCRELARRSARPEAVVLRGGVADRVVLNAEELTLQAMTTEVSVVMAKFAAADRPVFPKLLHSLENSLDWLDAHVDEALAALPADRALSFFEVTLFALVTHLPFKELLPVARYAKLVAFCDRFAAREGARRSAYRYDATP